MLAWYEDTTISKSGKIRKWEEEKSSDFCLLTFRESLWQDWGENWAADAKSKPCVLCVDQHCSSPKECLVSGKEGQGRAGKGREGKGKPWKKSMFQSHWGLVCSFSGLSAVQFLFPFFFSSSEYFCPSPEGLSFCAYNRNLQSMGTELPCNTSLCFATSLYVCLKLLWIQCADSGILPPKT